MPSNPRNINYIALMIFIGLLKVDSDTISLSEQNVLRRP